MFYTAATVERTRTEVRGPAKPEPEPGVTYVQKYELLSFFSQAAYNAHNAPQPLTGHSDLKPDLKSVLDSMQKGALCVWDGNGLTNQETVDPS